MVALLTDPLIPALAALGIPFISRWRTENGPGYPAALPGSPSPPAPGGQSLGHGKADIGRAHSQTAMVPR